MTPEQKARVSIDALLSAAGWLVCDMASANIHAARGVAIREFPLNPGYGFADYLLYIDGKAAGVIEAKKEGSTAVVVSAHAAAAASATAALLTTVRPRRVCFSPARHTGRLVARPARTRLGSISRRAHRPWRACSSARLWFCICYRQSSCKPLSNKG